ncbi:MAG: GtrA family protein [Syntrophobacter sp.]
MKELISSAISKKSVVATFGRFLLSGGFNTVVTYALYLLLLRFLSYRISYTISFSMGIAIAYCCNRFFVFLTHNGLSTVALFPVVYLVQYLVGLGVVSAWVEILGLSVSLAPIAAIILTIPITFALSRWIFRRK